MQCASGWNVLCGTFLLLFFFIIFACLLGRQVATYSMMEVENVGADGNTCVSSLVPVHC